MTSISVEHVFSQGHLLLLHVHSWLSIQLTCALLCLGQWSALNLVKDSDVKASLTNDEVDEGEQVDMLQEGWDTVWLIWQFESWALGLNSKTMFVIYIATNLCGPCMLAGFCSVHEPLSLPLPAHNCETCMQLAQPQKTCTHPYLQKPTPATTGAGFHRSWLSDPGVTHDDPYAYTMHSMLGTAHHWPSVSREMFFQRTQVDDMFCTFRCMKINSKRKWFTTPTILPIQRSLLSQVLKKRLSTPALPHICLLQLDICSGAKSGLTAWDGEY